MTDNTNNDAALPKFSVNVVPTVRITSEHLGTLLERFRQGENEPLVFGDGNVPEAAVIPFADFVRLMKHDYAEDHAFHSELARRVQAADASADPGATLEELGEELGEPARSIIRRTRDHG